MPTQKTLDKNKLDQIVADAHRSKAEREKGYREQALKLYPWICGRCAREFNHTNLRELTVHHRDHNHDNNPADGSNWELLCLYCHDNEHARYENAHYNNDSGSARDSHKAGTHNPFANLDSLLKTKK
ncbi:MAG: YajD family HNH nuclease [Gammaproteobacteria bacterium]